MSHSAADLISDVEAGLTELGYEIDDEPSDEGGGFFYSFGGVTIGPYESGTSAIAGAFEDLANRHTDLRHAAALVLAHWESGDLAAAVRRLQDAVDAVVPGDVNEYVAGIAASDPL